MLSLPTLPKTEEQLRAYFRELQHLWAAVVTGEIGVTDKALEELQLNHHRLEAGGFGSRLQARLLWVPEKTKFQASSPMR